MIGASMRPDQWLQRQWYDRGPPLALIPPSWLFRAAVGLRRTAYERGWKRSEHLPVPVIVVGNLTLGGVGKTPLTIWLVDFLQKAGYKPGVISRGYGGRKQAEPLAVNVGSDPLEAGDEPVLIARRTGRPVYVFPRRVEAGRALLAATDCDIVVADDGLQHYALQRDVEIVVVDGDRRFGNGYCLPAGPLRETADRLREADLVVSRGRALPGEYMLDLNVDEAVNLRDENLRKPLADFVGVQSLYAIAGIGNPQRFFEDLRNRGLVFEERAFPDHHRYRPEDLAFGAGATVLMTEKDAVKCRGLAGERLWCVPLRGKMPPAFGETLLQLLKAERDGQETA